MSRVKVALDHVSTNILVCDRKYQIIFNNKNSERTLQGMEKVITAAGGKVAQVAAAFTEGDADWSHVIALGNLPVFTE